MKNKLTDLPTIMEKGAFKGHSFTEESKEIVRNRIKKKQISSPEFTNNSGCLWIFGSWNILYFTTNRFFTS